jgi:hypothetical protein
MSLVEYLEETQPSFEDATMELLRMIRQDKPREDILEMVDYIGEFWQETDPVAMGWVGSDGLP